LNLTGEIVRFTGGTIEEVKMSPHPKNKSCVHVWVTVRMNLQRDQHRFVVEKGDFPRWVKEMWEANEL